MALLPRPYLLLAIALYALLATYTTLCTNQDSINTLHGKLQEDQGHDDHTALTSCKDRCHANAQTPCSCNKVCLVHDNCCEDFELFCSSTSNLVSEDLPSLINAQTKCHMTGIFIITSCDPQNVQGSHALTTTLGPVAMETRDPFLPPEEDGLSLDFSQTVQNAIPDEVARSENEVETVTKTDQDTALTPNQDNGLLLDVPQAVQNAIANEVAGSKKTDMGPVTDTPLVQTQEDGLLLDFPQTVQNAIAEVTVGSENEADNVTKAAPDIALLSPQDGLPLDFPQAAKKAIPDVVASSENDSVTEKTPDTFLLSPQVGSLPPDVANVVDNTIPDKATGSENDVNTVTEEAPHTSLPSTQEDGLPLDFPQAVQNAIADVAAGSENALDMLLANSPVTDVDNNLTFLNFSVYKQCSRWPDTKASHAVWTPVVALNYILLEPASLEGLGKDMAVWYEPPPTFTVNKYSYSVCIHSAIGECTNRTDAGLVELCEKGATSYVSAFAKATAAECRDSPHAMCSHGAGGYFRSRQHTFKNKYCLQCSSAQFSPPTPTAEWSVQRKQRFSLKFQMTFHFQQTGFSVIMKQVGLRRQTVPWQKADCHLAEHGRVTQSNKLQCQVNQCPEGFLLSKEKTCKRKYSLIFVLVLRDNITKIVEFSPAMTAILLDHFGILFNCYIQSIGFTMGTVQGKGLVPYKDGVKGLLVASEVFLHDMSEVLVARQFNTGMIQGLKEVALLSKLMVGYVDAFVQCASEINTTTETVMSVHHDNDKWSQVMFSDMEKYYYEIKEEMMMHGGLTVDPEQVAHTVIPPLPCNAIFDKSEPWFPREKHEHLVEFQLPRGNVTSCVCTFIPEDRFTRPCAVACWDTPVYPDDAENVLGILQGGCLPITHPESTSINRGTDTVRPSGVLLLTLVGAQSLLY